MTDEVHPIARPVDDPDDALGLIGQPEGIRAVP
jgi:hypothetical protein